ncbi:MFS transporter [Fructobacillus sp. M1-13]|uniref:Multidrug efflux MFS transporter n=1 Tax=Fructobacillus papyriferae TaxID=2713171 RepID=A0ABS5QNH4_9LACO|nr:MFS transporter [Fructobacillus papyriferae]MBS9334590.1 multidrug efflux MFS transporter [Fructobacillus papyriferae]MCD2158579.1 MFS transporter [Fructobacillus papyriferae]
MTENAHTIDWKRNMWIIWLAVMMTGIAFSEIVPFLSLYIDTMGRFTSDQLNFYSGAAFAVTFLVSAIVSPLWGKLADKKGRKLMMMRAALGLAFVMALTGFSQNVWQLIFLRGLQGALGGFISNSNALIATQTPKDQVGRALGIVVTGFTGGTLMGPLIGGSLATFLSYRQIFLITATIFVIVFFFIWILVEEKVPEKPAEDEKPKPKMRFSDLANWKVLLALFTTTMLVQIVNMAINPIVALFVREVLSGHSNITFITGLVAAMPGCATFIFASWFGRLGDHIGTKFMLQMGFVMAVIAFVPTAFVTTVFWLLFFRFAIGIADATLLPAIQTLLSRNSPDEMVSRVFSYNQSFQSIGSVLGPLCGTVIASVFDYRAIFIFTAIVMAINGTLFYFNIYRNKTVH